MILNNAKEAILREMVYEFDEKRSLGNVTFGIVFFSSETLRIIAYNIAIRREK